jgi:hypothetical protein
MRDHDVGDVLVAYDRDLFGALTDRDIVVRAIAQDRDPDTTTAGSGCTRPTVVTLPPTHHRPRGRADAPARRAQAPGGESGGCPVGIVSLGDLAVTGDPRSVLADTGRAEPNG